MQLPQFTLIPFPRGCFMTPGRLSPRSEFTSVPSHGSIFVYTIPPQNVMPARVTPAWVQPGSCTGARISLRYEISQRYHVNAKRPPVSVWNRPTQSRTSSQRPLLRMLAWRDELLLKVPFEEQLLLVFGKQCISPEVAKDQRYKMAEIQQKVRQGNLWRLRPVSIVSAGAVL